MSDTSIEDWERTILEYGRTARYQPPDILAGNLASDLAELRDELSRCRSARTMRRLTKVTAEMAGLMVSIRKSCGGVGRAVARHGRRGA